MDNAGLLLEKAEKRNQLLIKARDEAEVSCEKYRLQLIEAESMLDRDAALRLAGQLKEGVACPVCGSEHHLSLPLGRIWRSYPNLNPGWERSEAGWRMLTKLLGMLKPNC